MPIRRKPLPLLLDILLLLLPMPITVSNEDIDILLLIPSWMMKLNNNSPPWILYISYPYLLLLFLTCCSFLSFPFLSLFFSFYLDGYLYIYIYLYIFISIYLYLYIYLSIYLYLYLYIYSIMSKQLLQSWKVSLWYLSMRWQIYWN